MNKHVEYYETNMWNTMNKHVEYYETNMWNTMNKHVEYYETNMWNTMKQTRKLRNNMQFRYYARNHAMFCRERVTNNSF